MPLRHRITKKQDKCLEQIMAQFQTLQGGVIRSFEARRAENGGLYMDLIVDVPGRGNYHVTPYKDEKELAPGHLRILGCNCEHVMIEH